MVPVTVYQALLTVQGLRKGKTAAREPEPIRPVSDAEIDATLPHLPPVVANMVRFQRLVGCRPGEVCIIRPCDVERSGDVWCYVPESHKTKAAGLVAPCRPKSPATAEALERYRAEQRRFNEALGKVAWSPNQLRHAAATELRRRYGIEAAQTVLGHSKADVTQVYAERDFSLAARVMAEVG
jgi:integrase